MRGSRSVPSFFVSVLTDIGAERHFAAVLAFCEPRFPSESPVLLEDDVDDLMLTATQSERDQQGAGLAASAPVLYCPKCLVIVSRHGFFETFRVKNAKMLMLMFANMIVEVQNLR